MRSLELFDLTGKTAIVTGGGRGLGFVMAEALAEAGSNVVICSRKQEACESAAKKLNNNGIKALGFECDITNPFQVERLKQYVLSELGQIDILINNSAITWGASFEEYPLDKWERVIEVNVTGTFICCQIIGQAMVDNDCGKIINIGSVYGQIGSPPEVMQAIAYHASKGAVQTFTKDLAVKWAKHNIQVNIIAPAFIESDLSRGTMEKAKQEILARVPIKRFGKPEDIKGAVVFLASAASDYVTGSTLLVDGGYLAM